MLTRIWNLFCSLKLAICLASAATLLLMGGSLLIPFNPSVFASMDQFVLGDWLSRVARHNVLITWWLYLAAVLMILFGINTLCCFLDWLRHLGARWRKSGEYLLHLGVVLVLCAYIWGSLAGWRQTDLRCRIGTPTPLSAWPGHYLRVDSFKPVFDKKGPPLDMISAVTLLQGDETLQQGTVQINHPLLRGGLVITPVSFGQVATGFMFALPEQRPVAFEQGRRIQLSDGARLEVLHFLPDAHRNTDGSVTLLSERLGNPAFELRCTLATGRSWQGWYFITRRPPIALTDLGISLRPIEPLFASYSVLTVNYDPGAPLAAAGGGLMTGGVLLALFSFYRKRRRQDRPEIW